jgi:hypothetical protein
MTDSTGPRAWPNLPGASSQDLGSARPGKLLLRTEAVCHLDPQHLLEVSGERHPFGGHCAAGLIATAPDHAEGGRP